MKTGVGHTQRPAHGPGTGQVLQVVATKYLQRHRPFLGHQFGNAVHDAVFRRVVALGRDARRPLLHQGLHHGVGRAVDQPTTGLDGRDEAAELVHVVVEGPEHVHVVPRDAADQRDVRPVQVELGHRLERGGQVFIPLDHRHPAAVAEPDHAVEALQLRTHQVVQVHAFLTQHVHHHAGDGGLAVASPDHHAGLLPGAFVEIGRVAVDGQTELLRPKQLGIVGPGMHAQDHRLQALVDAAGIPAHAGRQQPQVLQAAAAGFEDLVVTARHLESLAMEGNGHVVHGTASDGDEVDPAHRWRRCVQGALDRTWHLTPSRTIGCGCRYLPRLP